MKLEPNAQTVRWMTEWVEIQKAQMLALLERGWETVQPLHRPHDQVGLDTHCAHERTGVQVG